MNRIRSALTAVKLIRDTVQADGQVVITAEGGFIAENCDKTIIKALEKQIPQKPIRANNIITKGSAFYLDEDNEYWKCPVCTQYSVPLRENQKRCHYCGQAIDWGTDNA